MFDSDILEVVIGVVFVFVLVSTICSAGRESLEAWLKTRASYLEFAIRELLQDKPGTGLARQFFEHPLIYGLYFGQYTPGKCTEKPRPWRRGKNLPSYIPARSFAVALLDLVARGPKSSTTEIAATFASPLTSEQLRTSVARIQNPAVQRALLVAIDASRNDLDRLRENIEAWYDSTMDRVSGWYKRSTQWILFWIALLIAVGANINTITVADYLFRHDTVRSAIVAQAEKAAAAGQAASASYEQTKQQLEDLHLPIGWSNGWGAPLTRLERRSDDLSPWNDVFGPLIGWLITAFAATLGASFWFDLLNKIMVIRSTVKPHEKSPEEGSEDRREPSRRATTSAAPQPAHAETFEADQDSCGVGELADTPDERLPAARGGVA
jgi:hypothetical protein